MSDPMLSRLAGELASLRGEVAALKPSGTGVSTAFGATNIRTMQAGFPAELTSAYNSSTGYSWKALELNIETPAVVNPTIQVTGDKAFTVDGNESLASGTRVWLEAEPRATGYLIVSSTDACCGWSEDYWSYTGGNGSGLNSSQGGNFGAWHNITRASVYIPADSGPVEVFGMLRTRVVFPNGFQGLSDYYLAFTGVAQLVSVDATTLVQTPLGGGSLARQWKCLHGQIVVGVGYVHAFGDVAIDTDNIGVSDPNYPIGFSSNFSLPSRKLPTSATGRFVMWRIYGVGAVQSQPFSTLVTVPGGPTINAWMIGDRDGGTTLGWRAICCESQGGSLASYSPPNPIIDHDPPRGGGTDDRAGGLRPNEDDLDSIRIDPDIGIRVLSHTEE